MIQRKTICRGVGGSQSSGRVAIQRFLRKPTVIPPWRLGMVRASCMPFSTFISTSPTFANAARLSRRFVSSSYSSHVPCVRFDVSTDRLARATRQHTLPLLANIYSIDLRKTRRGNKRVSARSAIAEAVAAHMEERRKTQEPGAVATTGGTTPACLVCLVKTNDTAKQAVHRQEALEEYLIQLGAFGEVRVCVLDAKKSRNWTRLFASSTEAKGNGPLENPEEDAAESAAPTASAAATEAERTPAATDTKSGSSTWRSIVRGPEGTVAVMSLGGTLSARRAAAAVPDSLEDVPPNTAAEDAQQFGDEDGEEVWEEVEEVEEVEEIVDEAGQPSADAVGNAEVQYSPIEDDQNPGTTASKVGEEVVPPAKTAPSSFMDNISEALRSSLDSLGRRGNDRTTQEPVGGAAPSPPMEEAATVKAMEEEGNEDDEWVDDANEDEEYQVQDSPVEAIVQVPKNHADEALKGPETHAGESEEALSTTLQGGIEKAHSVLAEALRDVDLESQLPLAIEQATATASETSHSSPVVTPMVHSSDSGLPQTAARPSAPTRLFQVPAHLYRGARTVHLSDRAHIELPVKANVLVVDQMGWSGDDATPIIDAAMDHMDPALGPLLLYPESYVWKTSNATPNGDDMLATTLPFVMVFRTHLSPAAAVSVQQQLTAIFHRHLFSSDAAPVVSSLTNDRSTICVLNAAETERGGPNPLAAPTSPSSKTLKGKESAAPQMGDHSVAAMPSRQRVSPLDAQGRNAMPIVSGATGTEQLCTIHTAARATVTTSTAAPSSPVLSSGGVADAAQPVEPVHVNAAIVSPETRPSVIGTFSFLSSPPLSTEADGTTPAPTTTASPTGGGLSLFDGLHFGGVGISSVVGSTATKGWKHKQVAQQFSGSTTTQAVPQSSGETVTTASAAAPVPRSDAALRPEPEPVTASQDWAEGCRGTITSSTRPPTDAEKVEDITATEDEAERAYMAQFFEDIAGTSVDLNSSTAVTTGGSDAQVEAVVAEVIAEAAVLAKKAKQKRMRERLRRQQQKSERKGSPQQVTKSSVVSPTVAARPVRRTPRSRTVVTSARTRVRRTAAVAKTSPSTGSGVKCIVRRQRRARAASVSAGKQSGASPLQRHPPLRRAVAPAAAAVTLAQPTVISRLSRCAEVQQLRPIAQRLLTSNAAQLPSRRFLASLPGGAVEKLTAGTLVYPAIAVRQSLEPFFTARAEPRVRRAELRGLAATATVVCLAEAVDSQLSFSASAQLQDLTLASMLTALVLDGGSGGAKDSLPVVFLVIRDHVDEGACQQMQKSLEDEVRKRRGLSDARVLIVPSS